MVEFGVTVTVPPVDDRLYELPSDPVTTTLVALLAVTVSRSELPALIELFCAEIDTVGFCALDPTVIVTCAVELPLEFVDVAVYVVVEVGDTVSVPPLYGSEYEVPFDPVTFTDADLLAVTVSVTDCPAVMFVELAVIETTGFDPDPPPPDPLTVIVVWALALPLEFVATAVYVVVDVGATVRVPPLYGSV